MNINRITPAEALRHPFLADPPPSHVPPPPPNTVESSAVDSWLAPDKNSFGVGGSGGGVSSSNSQHQHREHPTKPASVGESSGLAAESTTVGISKNITPLPPRAGSRLDSGSDCNDNDDNRDRDEAFNNFMGQRPRSAPERRRPTGGGRGRGRGGANSGGSGSASMVDDVAADVGGEAEKRGSSRLAEGSENNNHNLTGVVAALRSTDVLHADAALADQSAERRNRYRGHGNAHDRDGDGGPRGARVGSGGSSSGGFSGCGNRVVGEKGSGGGSSSSGGGRGGGKGAGASRSGSGSRGRLSGSRRIRSVQGVGGLSLIHI